MSPVFDFIANCTDGVFAVDRRQKIVLWNAGATRILGHRPGEVLGKNCYGILRGCDAAGCAVCRKGCDAIEAAQKLELPPTAELLAQTQHRKDIWLSLSTIVVPSRRHELSVLVHLFHEISQQQDLTHVVREFAGVVADLTSHGTLPQPQDTDQPAELTPREREILGQLALGVSTADIAERLSISPRTVRNHVNNILVKLDVHSRLEAVTYSIRAGLV